MVKGGFGMAALMTHFPSFACDDESAKMISEPAARILSRHPELAAAIVGRSDIAALFMGIVGVTAPRVIAYRAWLTTVQPAAERAYHEAQQQPNNAGGVDTTNLPDWRGAGSRGSRKMTDDHVGDLKDRLHHD